jgi:hypothetical protein
MLGTKARPELQTLQDQLRGWQSSVPSRARRFHAARTDLDGQVHQAQAGLQRLWVSQDVVDRLRDRVDRLGEVAEPLAAVIRDAERLEEELHRLERRPQEAKDQDLGQWLAQKCRDWTFLLGSLGTDCDREADVSREQRRLRETESAIRLLDQAFVRLEEAESTLALLDKDPRAATLAADLPLLRRQLVDQGPSYEWLQTLQQIVQPLKEAAARIQDPPQELKNISALLTDLRGWSRQLGEWEDQVELLEQKRHFRAADWDLTDLRDLEREAQALRDRLLARGQELRKQRLAVLEEQLNDLAQACGPQPDLEQRLAAVKLRTFDRYQLFRDWMSQVDQVEDYFKSIASTQESALEQRLSQLTSTLLSQVREVQSWPLSDEVRREAEVFAFDVGRLAKASGVEQILRGLRDRGELEQRIERIAQQARGELEELSQQQQRLFSLNQEIQLHSETAGLDLPDLSHQINELGHGEDKKLSLEQARSLAGRLTQELEELRSSLVQRCREKLARQIKEMRATASVLRRAGTSLRLPKLPDVPSGAGPAQAAQALATATDLACQQREVLKETLLAFEKRRQQIRTSLQQISLPAMGVDEQDTVRELLLETESGSWSLTEDPVERLSLLAELAEKCEILSERMHQEERTARERRESLRRRLQRHRDNQMRRFSPDFTDRVAALVYGIPERPGQWRAVHKQLDEAERLLGQIDAQAARLAADELDTAADELRHRPESGDREVRRLLDKLDRYPQDVLPPVTLRQRIVQAAERRAKKGFPR